MYDYYFEKDTAVEHVADVGGHRHDWEHIIVFTHCFRFARADDDRIENHKGVWLRGARVNWQGLEDAGVRGTLIRHDFGKAHMAIEDSNIKRNIDCARNGGAYGFDSERDE